MEKTKQLSGLSPHFLARYGLRAEFKRTRRGYRVYLIDIDYNKVVYSEWYQRLPRTIKVLDQLIARRKERPVRTFSRRQMRGLDRLFWICFGIAGVVAILYLAGVIR